MNLKLFTALCVLLVVVSAATIQVRAQSNNVSVIPIRISDDEAVADSALLYLVTTPSASWERDSINQVFQEIGNPPVFGFGAVWVPWATYVNGPLGFAGDNFTPMCIQGVPAGGQRDTFVISCTNTDAGAEDFILQWSAVGYLAARCDSIFLQDKTGLLTTDGSTPVGKINMFNQDSLFIYQPLQTLPTFKLTVYIYGAHLRDSLSMSQQSLPNITTSVRELSHQIPSSFRLQQNYPNPFNPTTTVRFDIQKQSVTEIAVYNLLGQKVATLISQNLMPGTYSAVWNGLTSRGLSAGSGVYFIRMTARPSDGRGGVFSSLQKIVLMK